jgi:phage-related protein
MDNMMWEVEFFQHPGGRCPAHQFLSTLNEKTDLPYIEHIFSLAEQYGHRLPRPHSAPLREKICELRVKTRNGQFRFLYFFDHKKIIITHGFKKKTGKVPNSEIEKAIKYREMYFESGKS